MFNGTNFTLNSDMVVRFAHIDASSPSKYLSIYTKEMDMLLSVKL